MAERSKTEPILWSLFGAGGMVSAVFLPIHVLVLALVVPMSSAMSYDGMQSMLGGGTGFLLRVYLFVVLVLSFFHAAHRLRFTLIDMKLHAIAPLITAVCYGSSALLTLVAFYVLTIGI